MKICILLLEFQINGKKQTQIYFLIKILIRIFKLLNKAIQIYSKYTVLLKPYMG